MMRRCTKCYRTRSVALTVFGRNPLHFCATCARLQGAKYLPVLRSRTLRSPFNTEALLLKRAREVL